VEPKPRSGTGRSAAGDPVRAAFEQAPVGLALATPDGRLLAWNAAFAVAVGRDPAHPPPTLAALCHGRAADAVTAALAGGRAERLELQLAGDGAWIALLMTPLDGMVAITAHSPTVGREATDSLAAIRTRLEKAERLAHVGSVLWDLERGEVWCSDEWLRINGFFGLVGGREGGRHLPVSEMWALLHPDDRAQVQAASSAAMVAGRPFDMEHRIVRHDDGEVRVIHSYGEAVYDAHGEPRWLYGAAQDVTERALAERERRHFDERLQAGQRLAAIGQLAGGVAHDFNNLVTAILVNAEILRGVLDGEGARLDALGEIEQAARRAAALTQQLLAFGRRQAVRAEALDPNAVVREALRMLAPLLGEHIRLRERLDPGVGPVWADRNQLVQVLVNLVLNARDAMPAGGTLAVETAAGVPSERGEHRLDGVAHVRLRVVDTGAGMDEATAQRVFEPFFTTKAVGEGSGLGLSVVWGIVEQAGGVVRVDSTPGAGTAMTVLLPLSSVAPGPPTEAAPAPAPRTANVTILLCEDEPLVRRPLALLLEDSGLRVLVARDGAHALALAAAATEPIAALVTDVVMPGMTGIALAEALRVARPGLPVVLMSGYAEPVMELRALDARTRFVGKPCTLHDILARLDELLGA